MSSALRRKFRLVHTPMRSSMCNRNRIGPKIDPCGTPHSILKKDVVVLFIYTYLIRLDR